MSRVTSHLVALALVSVSALACSSSSSDGAEAQGSTSSADDSESIASASQASYSDSVLLGSIKTNDPATAAASVSAAQWWPAGCVTRAADATDPLVAHVTLNDCTGPFGLVHFTGDITLTFSAGASGGLHVEGAGSNLTINNHPATFARSADITFDATALTLTVVGTGAWTREDAAGETVSHTRSETTVIDATTDCRTSNGSAVTDVGSREIDSTFTDYKICKTGIAVDGCPSGTVQHVRKASGDTVTVTFDGSNEAKLTGPNGNSVEVALVCGGALDRGEKLQPVLSRAPTGARKFPGSGLTLPSRPGETALSR